MPKLNIHPAIAKLEKRIIALRRHFHQHPELSFQETETAQSILAELKGLNLEVRYPVARTGIVAVLRNGNGPCIALRADMDALPIQETGDRPYKSVNDGVMHACGHDGHLAILLGTLLALENSRDLWRGTLKFIFQPAEEGPAGARYMVEEGVLKEPKVRAIFGLHLWNYQDFGTIGVKAGAVMAAADRFTITVRGKGGHGAMPQGTVDAVIVAAQLVMSLQSIVSRNLNPLESGVVTVGQIHGGDNFNIIADEVTLTGTARAYREEDRQLIKSRIKAICDGTAASHGAAIELDYQDGYPPTINDPAMTETLKRVILGISRWESGPSPIRFYVSPRQTANANFRNVAIGFISEIIRDDQVMMIDHCWWMGGDGVSRRNFGSWSDMDMDVFRKTDFSAGQWSIHVKSDPDLALRAGDALKYWEGEFTIPMPVRLFSGNAPVPHWWIEEDDLEVADLDETGSEV